MNRKLSFIITSLIITATTTLFASRVEIIRTKNDRMHTYNEIDNKYNAQHGFAFYQDKNSSLVKTTKNNCCLEMLKTMKKILKEQKKQTKIQNKILKILQKRLDPQPKVITVNGKKCIANSSAECFQMPITAAAQRVPALLAWMKNPTMANTVNYLRWQAKYFTEIYRRADSFPLAISQFGEKAYPLAAHRLGYTSLQGFNIKDLKMKRIIASTKDNFKYLIFLGLNKDLDITSVLNIKALINKYKDLSFTIIFKDKNSKNLFEETANAIYSKKSLSLLTKTKKVINSNAFDKYQIFTTPSIVVIDMKKKKAQTICNGKVEVGYFEEQMFNYLEYNKEIDHTKMIDYKNWNNGVDYRENYYKHILGININSILKEKNDKK